MSRGLTAQQQTEVAKSELKTRTLVTIELDSGPMRFLANDTASSLIVDSNTYNARMIKTSAVETSLDGTTDNMVISVSDIAQEFSATVATNGDVLTNRTCKVEEVIFTEETPAWTPAELTNLAAWFDASDINSITLNGSNISQWNDKSGNNYHATQGTTSIQPYYDSTNNRVSFDGTGTRLIVENNFHVADGNNSCFVVFDATTGGRLFNGFIGTGTRWGVYPETSSQLRVLSHYNFAPVSTNIDLTVTRNCGFTRNGTTIQTYYDGNAGTSSESGADKSPYLTHSIGARDDGGYSLTGNVYEIIVTTNALSTSDRQKLEGYLAHKWGTEANLPAGHPYKNSPPSGGQKVSTILDAPVLLFDGKINKIQLTAKSLVFTVERLLNNYSSLSPNMVFDVNCQWKFKDSRCGYSDGETKCDKTLTRCKALSNVTNFGGYPSVVIPTPTK